MALEEMPLMGMIKEKMSWLTARQEVLAQNVANADTPGYRAKDLKRPDFRAMMEAENVSLAMRHTSSAHMASTTGEGTPHRTERSGSWEVVPDGNSVVLEQEMMRVTETAGEYRLAANLYSKSVNLVRMAIGRS